MAATLAHATMAARLLARMTDRIATDRTSTAVLGAGALTTGPAELATTITVGFAANRTGRDATGGTQQFLAPVALGNTGITDEVAIAIQNHCGHFGMTDLAVRTMQATIIAIA